MVSTGRVYDHALMFLTAPGKTVRTVQYVAGVSIFKSVAVAGVEIRRGDVIDPADIEYHRIDVATIDDYFEETDAIDDMQAARTIRKGMPLTVSNVKPVPLIRRGDRVMVTTRIGSVVAMIEGTARQDGGRGETIRVVNEVTRKSLEGVVINERTVQVGFLGGSCGCTIDIINNVAGLNVDNWPGYGAEYRCRTARMGGVVVQRC